jgi:hypothetical protein
VTVAYFYQTRAAARERRAVLLVWQFSKFTIGLPQRMSRK